MVNKKPVRTRGKISFSKYFQTFNDGDSVSIIREPALNTNFPKRLQGRTGKISGKRGKAYIVLMNDQSKLKTFLVEPAHLKKIKQ